MIDAESQALVENFLTQLTNTRGYSPHTIAAYRRDLEDFMDYLSRKQAIGQATQSWADVDIQRVRDYAAQRHRAGLSGRSLQRALSALRVFFRYLVTKKKVESNPVQHVRAPRSPRKLPKVLDVDQMDGLLTIKDNDPLTLRDRAIMELAYSSGLRLAELVSLDLSKLDLSEREVDVVGKGGKQRKVPIGRMACAALIRWLAVRQALAAADEAALFVGQRGRRLTPRAIQLRMRAWAVRLGLDRCVHPHMLRHAFASHLLESSGDLRAVQELLGHADISTTQVYTHIDFQHLAEVYDKAHPRARK
jgi:integrase/recombinase XerC